MTVRTLETVGEPGMAETLEDGTVIRVQALALAAAGRMMAEAFPDGHYSGSPDFDPNVFGAD